MRLADARCVRNEFFEAEIDPATLNLDVEDAAAKVTDRTKAIIPVHLFGRAMDVRPLVELGADVLEDAAQAFGAEEVARHGKVSTFSFYPTKNLFCLGDGGLVTTNNEELAGRVQLLSFHGSRDRPSGRRGRGGSDGRRASAPRWARCWRP